MHMGDWIVFNFKIPKTNLYDKYFYAIICIAASDIQWGTFPQQCPCRVDSYLVIRLSKRINDWLESFIPLKALNTKRVTLKIIISCSS